MPNSDSNELCDWASNQITAVLILFQVFLTWYLVLCLFWNRHAPRCGAARIFVEGAWYPGLRSQGLAYRWAIEFFPVGEVEGVLFLFCVWQEFEGEGAVGVIAFSGIDFGAEGDAAVGAAFYFEAIDVVFVLGASAAFVAIAGEDA